MNSSTPKTCPFAWHWVRFDCPEAWELTGFSLPEEKGNLQFYTRAGFCANLGWRTVKGIPDNERIQSEVYRRRIIELTENEETPPPKLTFQEVNGFLLSYCPEANLILASKHLPQHKILLEWSLPHDTIEPQKNLLLNLLKSFQPNDGEVKHWAFQDIHIKIPSTYFIQDLLVFPGSTTATFATYRKAKIIVRRWAMPNELLGLKPLDCFGRLLMAQVFRKVLDVAPCVFRSHSATRIRFKEKGKWGVERLVGSWWEGQSTIWRNDKLKRVFAYETYGPRRQPQPRIDDVWVE